MVTSAGGGSRSARIGVALALALVVVATQVAPVGAAKPAPAPDITRVSPDAAHRGARVEVFGRDFGGPRTKVWVGGTPATVLVATGSQAAFIVPVSAPFGQTTVRLSNPSGQTDTAPFTVLGWDGNLTIQPNSGARVSATIGRDGGALTGGGLRLDIPSGSLVDEVLITMTPLLGVSGSPFDGQFIAGAHFEPEGLFFLRPAILTMEQPAGVTPAQVLGFGAAGTGSGAHLLPSSVVGGSIQMEVWHFTVVGATAAGASATSIAASLQASSAEQAALTAIAAADAACATEQAAGNIGGPACLALDDAHRAALLGWYADLSPRLHNAAGAPFPDGEAAYAEWLRWAGAVQNLGLEVDLDTQVRAIRSEAERLVADHESRRLDTCDGTDLEGQYASLDRISVLALQGAFDYPLTVGNVILPPALDGQLLVACASIVVEALDLPQSVVSDTRYTLTGRASWDVWHGPNRTDIPLDLAFDADGGVISGGSPNPASDGSFSASVDVQNSVTHLRVTVTASNQAPFLLLLGLDAGSGTIDRTVVPRLSILPGDTVVAGGANVSINAWVQGDDAAGQDVTFSIVGPGALSGNSATTGSTGHAIVTYTAPSTAGVATISASIANGGGFLLESMQITIQVPVLVAIDPPTAIVQTGQQQQFTALVTGTTNTAVTWTASCGSVSSGQYTAPSAAGTCTVTATSIEDATVSATAIVTVIAATPTFAWFEGHVSAQDLYHFIDHHDDIELFPWPSSVPSWLGSETETNSGSAGSGSFTLSSRATGTVTPSFTNGYLTSVDIAASVQTQVSVTGCSTGDSLCTASAHARSDLDLVFDVGQSSTIQLSGTISATLGSPVNDDRVCYVAFYELRTAYPDTFVECPVDESDGSWSVSFNGVVPAGRYRLEVFTVCTSIASSARTSGTAQAQSTVHLQVNP